MMYDPRNNQSFYNQKHKATGGTRDVLTHTMSAKFKHSPKTSRTTFSSISFGEINVCLYVF